MPFGSLDQRSFSPTPEKVVRIKLGGGIFGSSFRAISENSKTKNMAGKINPNHWQWGKEKIGSSLCTVLLDGRREGRTGGWFLWKYVCGCSVLIRIGLNHCHVNFLNIFAALEWYTTRDNNGNLLQTSPKMSRVLLRHRCIKKIIFSEKYIYIYFSINVMH